MGRPIRRLISLFDRIEDLVEEHDRRALAEDEIDEPDEECAPNIYLSISTLNI